MHSLWTNWNNWDANNKAVRTNQADIITIAESTSWTEWSLRSKAETGSKFKTNSSEIYRCSCRNRSSSSRASKANNRPLSRNCNYNSSRNHHLPCIGLALSSVRFRPSKNREESRRTSIRSSLKRSVRRRPKGLFPSWPLKSRTKSKIMSK